MDFWAISYGDAGEEGLRLVIPQLGEIVLENGQFHCIIEKTFVSRHGWGRPAERTAASKEVR